MSRKFLILLLCGAFMHYFLGFVPKSIMPRNVSHLLDDNIQQIEEEYQPQKHMPKNWLVVVAGSSYRTLYMVSENKPDQQAVKRAFAKLGALPGEITSGMSKNRYVIKWHHQWSYLGRLYASTDLRPEDIRLRFVRAMGLPVKTPTMGMMVCVERCAVLDPERLTNGDSRDELMVIQAPFVAGEVQNISQWVPGSLLLVLAWLVCAFIWELSLMRKHGKGVDPKYGLAKHLMAYHQSFTLVSIMLITLMSRSGFIEMLGSSLADLWAGGSRNILFGLVVLIPLPLLVLMNIPAKYRIKFDLSKAILQLHERFPHHHKILSQIVYKRSVQIRHEDYILAKWDSHDFLGILPSVDHRRKVVIVPPMARLSMDITQLDFWITRALQDTHRGRNIDMVISLSVLIAAGITHLMGSQVVSITLSILYMLIVFLWIGGKWGIETARNTRADLAAIAITGNPESARRTINRLFGSGKVGKVETPKRILAIDEKYPPVEEETTGWNWPSS